MEHLGPRSWLPLLLLCALSACGGGRRVAAGPSGGGFPNYTAPGPPDDPWGPYIKQASTRFSLPESFPRAVIRQESGGRQYLRGQPITSDAGAMGLMQVMPATYGELAARYGLGSDPYDPHDNIMAGTGYIRELYDRYGSPGFLAAYNAGPHRLDTYLAGRGGLPNETVNYLASAAPNLGRELPMTGPLASFATGGGAAPPVLHDFVRPGGTRCWQDPDAAYDPDAPCRSAPAVQVARAAGPAYRPAPPSRGMPAGCVQDPDAAYDPASCGPAVPTQVAQAEPPPMQTQPASFLSGHLPPPVPMGASAPAYASVQPASARYVASSAVYRQPVRPDASRYRRDLLVPAAAAAIIRPAAGGGSWSIQMGAYASAVQARRVAESVRTLSPLQLGGTRAVLGATAPFGGQRLYRARLLGLSAMTAAQACSNLEAHAQACVTVAPGR